LRNSARQKALGSQKNTPQRGKTLNFESTKKSVAQNRRRDGKKAFLQVQGNGCSVRESGGDGRRLKREKLFPEGDERGSRSERYVMNGVSEKKGGKSPNKRDASIVRKQYE